MYHTKGAWKRKLTADAHSAEVALDILFSAQTAFERKTATTIHNNGIGFNQADAAILTPLGRKVYTGQALTREELAIAFNRLGKYAGQIANYMQVGREMAYA